MCYYPSFSPADNIPRRTAWIRGVDRDSQSLFGTTARELIKPVVGFHIRLERERLTQIENITAAAAKPTAAYRSSTGDFYFLLMDGEIVTQVAYSVSSGDVTAIRFETNLQGPSQWFGKLRGTVTTYTAPTDCAIHSLCPQSGRYGGYSKVGVVIWNLERLGPAMPPVSADREVREVCLLKSPCVAEESVVHSTARDLSGVWIQCAQVIEALSKSEHERLVTLQEDVSLPTNEHVVRILPHEKITAVEYTHTAGNALTAIRFLTRRRTTPWFGATRDKSPSQSERVHRCNQGEFICGFFASQTEQVSLASWWTDHALQPQPSVNK